MGAYCGAVRLFTFWLAVLSGLWGDAADGMATRCSREGKGWKGGRKRKRKGSSRVAGEGIEEEEGNNNEEKVVAFDVFVIYRDFTFNKSVLGKLRI